MASTRVTLRHIADHVGVHPSTVSRVLDPDKQSMVSADVIERVNRAVLQLGYRPNRAASGLRTNRSSTIGVVVPDISLPTFPKIIRGIQDVLAEDGYSCVVCSSDQRPARKKRIVEVMRKRQFDGLIVLATERFDPLVTACQEDGIPVSLLDKGSSPPSTPAVHMDDRLGVKLVVDHLTVLGHEKIAYISGPQRLSGAFSRHRFVIREMAERRLRISPALITACEAYSVEEGARCCERLLGSGQEFTAIIAANDLLAIGCFEILGSHGLDCPDDVSVVGYNDMGLSDKTDPPLTTVRFEQYERGRTLANLLLDRLRDPEAPIPYRRIEPQLVVRGSTGRPPAAPKQPAFRKTRGRGTERLHHP